MSDKARLDAIFAKVVALYPDRNIAMMTGEQWRLHRGSKAPPIRAYDLTRQDIGGQKEARAVEIEADGLRLYLSDEDLPAPTLKPRSAAVIATRQIFGFDPMPDWPRMKT